ncbi:TVP38/TMEM64 family protein [Sutcliffiella horikoshii]|uniref:TVP38/TMEM64 family protein n=1 Tax=Sutcliffiella horikoshii TaxID=79883 RepID=UPI001F34F8F1|nr:VTT domain-containing protein [Sutcliffiella horikoshii]
MVITETSKAPIKVLTHILFAGISIYILLNCLPTVLPFYKNILITIITSLIVLDTGFIFSKNLYYFKLTKSFYYILIGLILLMLVVYNITKFMVITEEQGLESILTEYGSMAKLIFFLVCLAQPIILPIPEAVTIPAGSVAFGAFNATLLSFSGTLLGIIIMFFIARYGGMSIASYLIKDHHLKKYQHYVGKNETVILGLLFIIPILPDEIICVGAGIGAVSFKRFLLIASFTKLFTSFVLTYSVTMAKVLSLSTTELVLYCSLIMGVLFLTTIAIKKRWNKKSLET